MKSHLKIIVPISICVLSLVLFNVFRTVPESHHWKGFQLVYVSSNEFSEGDILSVLSKNGAKDVVSKKTLTLPKFSEFAPIQAQPADSYLFRRESFFSDESNSAMVFYVPSKYSSAVQKTVRELSGFRETVIGTDGASSFPWIPPLVTLAFAIICLFFAENFKYFLPAVILPLFFAFCRPLASVSASCCLSFTALVFVIKICDRKEFFRTLKNSKLILFFLGFPLVALIFVSPLDSVFYLLSLVSAASMIFLVKTVSELKFTKNMFDPVFIRNARMVSVFERKTLKLMLCLSSAVLLLFLSSLFSGSVSSSDDSRPALPSPVTFGDSSALPNFSDFTEWYWNSLTFPYKKLGEEFFRPEEGEVVYMPEFKEVDGKIVEEQVPVYSFDDEFKKSVEDDVLSQNKNSLEKIILSQGLGAEFEFSRSSGFVQERFGKTFLLVFMIIPLIFAGYYILLGKKYGFSI